MDIIGGPDSEVKKLQDMVKQLEMQNQQLRKNSVPSRPYSPVEEETLDNVPIIDVREEFGEAEDSWLYESPVRHPTPQQKNQSPYKWCKSNLKPGLVLIRGNLLSKLNSAAFLEEEAELDDNDYDQTESLTVFLDENSPVRRRNPRPITSPKSRPPAKEAWEDDFGGEIRPRKSFQVSNNKGRFTRSADDFTGDIQPRRLPQHLNYENSDLKYNDNTPMGAVRPRKSFIPDNISDDSDVKPYMPKMDLIESYSRHSLENEQDEMWPLHMNINMSEVKPRKPLMDYDGDVKPRQRRSHGDVDGGDFVRPRGYHGDVGNDDFQVNMDISERPTLRSRKSFDELEDSDDGGHVVKRQPKRTLPQPQGASLRVSLPAGSGIRPRTTKKSPNSGSPYDSRESLDNGYDDEGEAVVRRRSLPVAPNKTPQSRPASSLSDNAIQHGTYTRSPVTQRSGGQNRASPRASGVVPRGSKMQPRRPQAGMANYDNSWQDGCF